MQLISPMLATLVPSPFNRPGWVNEEKYDGFRALAYRKGGRVRLFSRNLKEITGDYPEIARSLTDLTGGNFVFDGEIVAFDRQGVSRFQLLQRRALDSKIVPVFAIFDCLEKEGENLLKRPLSERREALEGIVSTEHPSLIHSRRLSPNGLTAYQAAKEKGWEGIIEKDESSCYEPGRRSRSWLKVKCRKESEFVIGGYTKPAGHRAHFGALLVGLYDGRMLRYTGKVGTGYTEQCLSELAEKMKPLRTSNSPFRPEPREKDATWVHPELVVQVAFEEWTKDGKLRQPAFLGLREDKAASECSWRERDR